MRKLVTLLVVLSAFNVVAQNRNWKKESSKDGKVKVKSEVVNTDDGKKDLLRC